MGFCEDPVGIPESLLDLLITKPQIFVNLHTNKLIQDRMIVNGSSVNIRTLKEH